MNEVKNTSFGYSSFYSCPQVVLSYDGENVVIQAGAQKAGTETVMTKLGMMKRRKGFSGAREKFLQALYDDECAYVDLFQEQDLYRLYNGRNEHDELCILTRAIQWAEYYHATVDQSVRERYTFLKMEDKRKTEERRNREAEEREQRAAEREKNDPIIHKGMRRSVLIADMKYGLFEIKDKADRLVFERWYEGRL